MAGDNTGSDAAAAAEPVGAALLRLRRGAQKTGKQLGDLVGMSQTKISRIETGQASASPADVARLARALGSSEEEVEELVARAKLSHDQMTDWRETPAPISGMQDDVGTYERNASVIRIFQPNLVVGLAQISEYARVIIGSISDIHSASASTDRRSSVTRAVTARVRRQEILASSDRQFHFVMSEMALGARLASPSVMIAQIERLGELADRENIQLKFLRAETRLPFPLLHGFELLDDAWVVIDIFNTAMTSRGSNDIAAYRAVFDRLETLATEDIEPILKKYRDMYLAELTRDDGLAS